MAAPQPELQIAYQQVGWQSVAALQEAGWVLDNSPASAFHLDHVMRREIAEA